MQRFQPLKWPRKVTPHFDTSPNPECLCNSFCFVTNLEQGMASSPPAYFLTTVVRHDIEHVFRKDQMNMQMLWENHNLEFQTLGEIAVPVAYFVGFREGMEGSFWRLADCNWRFLVLASELFGVDDLRTLVSVETARG